MIDKNQAVIDFLCQCDTIQGSPLYFNLVNAENDTIQIITASKDTTYSRPFIDGSVPKVYSFNIIVFKSITDLSLVKLAGYNNENVADVADVQALIDWIQAQDDLHNYPDFGESCHIDSITTTTDEPRFDGVNTSINPPLAMYSVSILINYIDMSKVIFS